VTDKSPLERDIEIQEQYRLPSWIYLLIAALILLLAASGVYIVRLKKELSEAPKEMKSGSQSTIPRQTHNLPVSRQSHNS